jgi:DNA-binding LytR/AlgR family response regulator
MKHAIALDDEPLALEIIAEFCASASASIDLNLVKIFTSPSEALKHLRKFPTDLLFLDIEMPSLSGIEFIKHIPQDTMVIFTTAHSEYAVESYNLNAVDYLLKPFEFGRFMKALTKTTDGGGAGGCNHKHRAPHDEAAQRTYIFLRAEYALVKIATADIAYIESLKDYLKIYCKGGKTIITRMTMKAILEALPALEFIRIHRSYIVPMQTLTEIRNKKVILDGKAIPIGVRYESDLRKQFF